MLTLLPLISESASALSPDYYDPICRRIVLAASLTWWRRHKVLLFTLGVMLCDDPRLPRHQRKLISALFPAQSWCYNVRLCCNSPILESHFTIVSTVQPAEWGNGENVLKSFL